MIWPSRQPWARFSIWLSGRRGQDSSTRVGRRGSVSPLASVAAVQLRAASGVDRFRRAGEAFFHLAEAELGVGHRPAGLVDHDAAGAD